MEEHGAIVRGMGSSKSYPTKKSSQGAKGKRKVKFETFVCSIKDCLEDCCWPAPAKRHVEVIKKENHICRCLNHFDEYMKSNKRNLAEEKGGVPTAPSGAMSSFEALFFHDVPPEVYKRLTQRYTGGHKKYGVGHTNLNWRVGLNDPKYIADRFNHAMDHIVNFLEDLNDKDDNLGGALWNIAFLIVAETRCPEAFREAFIQAKLFGEEAKKVQDRIKEQLK